MVLALFTRPSWNVVEESFTWPCWFTVEPFARPICTVVAVLAAWAADDRANTATEARSNLRMEYPFRVRVV